VSHPESYERPTATGSSDSAGWGSRDFTAAVYGAILAATVIVSSGDLRSPAALALLLFVSGVVFWLAHIYAATVAHRHGGWNLAAIRTTLRHEWPVALASLPPAVAAGITALVGFSPANGVWFALIVAILEQQVWGYAAARNAELGRRDMIIALGLNLVLGLVIIGLKLLVGH
jgi:hypothetical protein